MVLLSPVIVNVLEGKFKQILLFENLAHTIFLTKYLAQIIVMIFKNMNKELITFPFKLVLMRLVDILQLPYINLRPLK